jgi:hypothetical protein
MPVFHTRSYLIEKVRQIYAHPNYEIGYISTHIVYLASFIGIPTSVRIL